MTVHFDTLAARKVLERGGVATGQADSMVAAISMAFTDGVATSADIDRLDNKIDKLEVSMKAEIAGLETRMMKVFLGGVLFVVGAVLAGMKLIT